MMFEVFDKMIEVFFLKKEIVSGLYVDDCS